MTSIDNILDDNANALAKLVVSARDMSVKLLQEFPQRESCMARKKKKDSTATAKQDSSSGVQDIWKKIGMGRIDISYACVGYTHDGVPVLDQSLFTDMLINYGYGINDAMSFIDEFIELAKEDPSSPIVMTSFHSARIFSEIEPVAGDDK